MPVVAHATVPLSRSLNERTAVTEQEAGVKPEADRLADLDRLREAVQALAAEHPGRVYARRHGSVASCSYHPDDANPDGCIIGAALRRCGARLEYQDGYKREGSADDVIRWAFEWEGPGPERLGPEPGALVRLRLQWFRDVQTAQDTGATWGDAVAAHPWPEPEDS